MRPSFEVIRGTLARDRAERQEQYLSYATDDELSVLETLLRRDDAPALDAAGRLCGRLIRRAEVDGPPSARERRRQRRQREHLERWLAERERERIARVPERTPVAPEPVSSEHGAQVIPLLPRAARTERLTGREWISQKSLRDGALTRSLGDEVF